MPFVTGPWHGAGRGAGPGPDRGVQGGLPFHAADHARWDAQFPDHPLSRVRRILEALADAVRVEPGFAALPAFSR